MAWQRCGVLCGTELVNNGSALLDSQRTIETMPVEEEGYPSTELPAFDNAPNYYAAILEYSLHTLVARL